MSKGRCKGGKYAKQRMTVLLIVNALREEEPPVISGSSVKARCFKKIQDKRRPCGSYYHANKKSWMHSELIEKILRTLNRKGASGRKCAVYCFSLIMLQVIQNILLFLAYLAFLPENVTSK